MECVKLERLAAHLLRLSATCGEHRLLRNHLSVSHQCHQRYAANSITGFGLLNKFWRIRRDRFKASYDVVKPGNVGRTRCVPSHIQSPNYNDNDNISSFGDADCGTVEIKTNSQIDKMRKAGQLARKILNIAVEKAQVGVTTDEIDCVVHEAIIENTAYPSPLLYRGFPKSVCTSVNNVACHGIPDDRPLKDGDIISVDVTVYCDGFHGDCAETVAVGDVDDTGRKLIEAARKCRDAAIEACHPGENFNIIGTTVSNLAKAYNFNVVLCCCGHGIGSYFHGPPDIFHFEPMISEGSDEIVILEDGWTAVTTDHSRTAQFEHTILITDDGVEILTK